MSSRRTGEAKADAERLERDTTALPEQMRQRDVGRQKAFLGAFMRGNIGAIRAMRELTIKNRGDFGAESSDPVREIPYASGMRVGSGWRWRRRGYWPSPGRAP